MDCQTRLSGHQCFSAPPPFWGKGTVGSEMVSLYRATVTYYRPSIVSCNRLATICNTRFGGRTPSELANVSQGWSVPLSNQLSRNTRIPANRPRLRSLFWNFQFPSQASHSRTTGRPSVGSLVMHCGKNGGFAPVPFWGHFENQK